MREDKPRRKAPARSKTPAQLALEEADLLQREIAVEVAVSEPTLSRILANSYPTRSVRSRRTVKRVRAHIAAKLGRSVDDLFGAPDESTAATAA